DGHFSANDRRLERAPPMSRWPLEKNIALACQHRNPIAYSPPRLSPQSSPVILPTNRIDPMKTVKTFLSGTASQRRAGTRSAFGHKPDTLMLETFEPRVMLAAYAFENYLAHLGYDIPHHDLAPPAMSPAGYGAAIAGLGDVNNDS